MKLDNYRRLKAKHKTVEHTLCCKRKLYKLAEFKSSFYNLFEILATD